MNRDTQLCDTMQEQLTARLQGALAPTELAAVEAHLEVCPACAAEAAALAELWHGLGVPQGPVPSERMRARLDALLAAEIAVQISADKDRASTAPLVFPAGPAERAAPPETGVRAGGSTAPASAGASRFARGPLALAAMLLVGLGLGYLLFGRNVDDVATLRREVGDLHTMVALSLLEKGSVSERLQGVAYSREVAVQRDFGIAQARGGPSAAEGPGAAGTPGVSGGGGEPVVAALFTRLLEDPNVNVRLAALEALRPLAARDDRRGEFVAAVARQQSPLVALSLIDLLLESNGAAARRDLEQLLANPHLDPVVRGYLRDRLGRSA